MISFKSKQRRVGLLLSREGMLAVEAGQTGPPGLLGQKEHSGGELSPVEVENFISSLNIKGGSQAAVSLDLKEMEVINLSVPSVPQEAMEDAVRFQLVKNLSRPVEEYVLDWQETSRTRDQVKASVYLMEREVFEALNQALARHRATVKRVEPEIFSLFALLDHLGRTRLGRASLCCCLWKGSISLGILQDSDVILARSSVLDMPKPEVENQAAVREVLEPRPPSDRAENLMEEFGLQMEQPEGVDEEEARRSSPFDKYVQDVTLELFRTRDYYTSVLKREGLESVILAGPPVATHRLKGILDEAMDQEVILLSEVIHPPDGILDRDWASAWGVVVEE